MPCFGSERILLLCKCVSFLGLLPKEKAVKGDSALQMCFGSRSIIQREGSERRFCSLKVYRVLVYYLKRITLTLKFA